MTNPEPLAYDFDAPHDARDELSTILGGKGAALAEMTMAGLPVPPGFTLTTEACHLFGVAGWTEELDEALSCGLARLEAAVGRRLGGDPPLLVSVRSGARESMPGMMDTVLNVGMSDQAERALAAHTGDGVFAADTHRRALLGFADVVLHVPPAVLAEATARGGPTEVRDALRRHGFEIPEEPSEQLRAAVRAVFESWNLPRARRYRKVECIPEDLGTAVTVQSMVFGNLGETSGTGVVFTRDPASGAQGLVGDFLVKAQGEDVVAGGHVTLSLAEMALRWPELYTQLEEMGHQLEQQYADMVDIEFTVEQGRLWLLQARRGKRGPLAAIRMAIEMAEDAAFPIDRREAVHRCQQYLADPPRMPVTDQTEGTVTVASGLAASPGRASGVLCVDPDEAVRLEADGVPVVLARAETSAADIHGMAAAAALFTTRGGSVSHAAVVARSWGLPAVVGAHEAEVDQTGVHANGRTVAVGELVTVDGYSGRLLLGGSSGEGSIAPEVSTIRAWQGELETPSPSGDGLDVGTHDFPLLHALRIKGMATADALATSLSRDVGDLEVRLKQLAEAQCAQFIEARSLWRLTRDGKDAHAEELAMVISALPLDQLPYDEFLELNDELKEACTAWQLRDGHLNDHEDVSYDESVLQTLFVIDERAQGVLQRSAAVVPWLSGYGPRLARAVEAIRSGDHRQFAGVMCDSYHDVWMELHQDLILTQGIDRAEEGST